MQKDQIHIQQDSANQPATEQNNQKRQQISVNQIKVQQTVSEDENTIQENLETAITIKKLANTHFSAQQYQKAIDCYFQALPYLSIQAEEHKKLRAVLYSNIAISLSKMKQCNNTDQIIKYCKKALKYDSQYYKAWLNMAKQYQSQSKWQQALEAYLQAQKIDKKFNRTQKYVGQRISILRPKVNQINEKRKQQVMKGLKDIGNSVLGFFGMSLNNFKMEQNSNGGYNIAFKQ